MPHRTTKTRFLAMTEAEAQSLRDLIMSADVSGEPRRMAGHLNRILTGIEMPERVAGMEIEIEARSRESKWSYNVVIRDAADREIRIPAISQNNAWVMAERIKLSINEHSSDPATRPIQWRPE